MFVTCLPPNMITNVNDYLSKTGISMVMVIDLTKYCVYMLTDLKAILL